MNKYKVNYIKIALVYTGAILGIWTVTEIAGYFKKTFGHGAYEFTILSVLLFVIIGTMAAVVSRVRHSVRLSNITGFGKNKMLKSLLILMAAFGLFVFFSNTAFAAYELFQGKSALFGPVGSACLVIAAVVTVTGGMKRMWNVFKILIPVLIVLTGIYMVMIHKELNSGDVFLYKPEMCIVLIFIGALLGIKAKSMKSAVAGYVVGGIIGGGMAFIMSKNTAPYESGLVYILHMMILIISVYICCVWVYYSISRLNKSFEKKKVYGIIIVIAGFLLGISGLDIIREYLIYVADFIGVLIFIFMCGNFVSVIIKLSHEKGREKVALFEEFEENDRFDFPENVYRVTGGHGGEAILVLGKRDTVLVDCGMAYCADVLIYNIREAMKKRKTEDNSKRKLDYIMITHTHYDHVGAMPYLRKEWPDLKVIGSAKAKEILAKKSALRSIKHLGEVAIKSYGQYEYGDHNEISVKGMGVDIVKGHMDVFYARDEVFLIAETKGHTDCSLTYFMEPGGIMFASESTGILESTEHVHMPILKSYEDAMESIRICKDLSPKVLILPHYGRIPDGYVDAYFDLAAKCAKDGRRMIKSWHEEGLSEDEMLSKYMEIYWKEEREDEQPREAFKINALNIIKSFLISVKFKEIEKNEN